MQNLIITHTFVSSTDLKASGLLEKWFANFGMTHIMEEKVQRMDAYKPTYYITEANPEHNYGLDFNIHVSYKADGINFFRQMCITSALTNGAIRRVMIENGQVSFGSQGYSKEQENRKALRAYSEAGWIFG